MTHPPPLSRDRVLHLIQRMKESRVVVVGDIMIDRYLFGDTERLSPEAPVPVVTVRERQAKLGGAANVAANVASLGARCLLVGPSGDDGDGAAIRQELAVARLDGRHVVTVAGRPTTSKTRIIARSQQIVRIDDEVDALLDGADLDRLIAAARDALADADALLLEDYNKGALAPQLIAAVMEIGRRRGIPVVVDPKYRQFFEYAGATVFKPNRRELESALGAAVDLQNRNALPEVLARLKVDNLLVTLGAEGMLLVTKDGSSIRIPEHRAGGLRRLGRGRHGDGVAGHRARGRAPRWRRRRSSRTTRREWRSASRAWPRCHPRRCSRCTRSGSTRSEGCGGAA